MPETLDTKRLRLALLARQGLLDKVDVPLPRAVERFGGLQTQYAPSPYVGLRSRVVGFERDDLTKALERRSIIQGTLMRATIHMVSRKDYWPFAAAIRDVRRRWWLRVTRHPQSHAEMHRTAGRLAASLADGPRRAKDLKEELGFDSATWNGAGLFVDLVRVPPSGTWERRRADLYALATNWVGPDDADPDDGLRLLVKRYLRAFGPATADDVAGYIGMTVGQIRPVLEDLPLRRFQSVDGDELLDVRNGLLPEPGVAVPEVVFLGTWDSTMLVHARRTQILPEEHRSQLFHTKVPQSVPPVLIDGQVRAAWKFADGAVTITPFEPLPKSVLRRAEKAAEELAEFHG